MKAAREHACSFGQGAVARLLSPGFQGARRPRGGPRGQGCHQGHGEGPPAEQRGCCRPRGRAIALKHEDAADASGWVWTCLGPATPSSFSSDNARPLPMPPPCSGSPWSVGFQGPRLGSSWSSGRTAPLRLSLVQTRP